MSAFVAAMDSRTVTENGAPCVSDSGVGSHLLALFFKLVRGLSDSDYDALFRAAATEAATPEAKVGKIQITVSAQSQYRGTDWTRTSAPVALEVTPK